MKKLLRFLFAATCILFSIQAWPQLKATVSYPFAVGSGSGSAQIYFYNYDGTTNNISSITSNTASDPVARYTPQLRYGTTNTQRFSAGAASVTYNPQDHNIYYAWMSAGTTYVWRWPVGSKPTTTNPSRHSNAYSFDFYAFLAIDAQGNGYFLEFAGTSAPYIPILRSVNLNTGAVGGRDTLQLTGGANIYNTGRGDITMTPSGQMLFVVDNKLFIPDYNSYTGTGKRLTCTYIDTVRGGNNMVGLTYADGEIMAAYSGGIFAEINPLTAASSPITKAAGVYSANDLATVVSGIGAAKRLVSYTATGTPNQYNVVYEVVVKNYGNYDLSSVQVTDDLTAINGAANVSNVTATFVSNPAGLVLNSSFNGNSNKNLLNGTGTLPNFPVANNHAVIRISCTLSNIEQGKLYFNSATATGRGFNNDLLTDVSTNGSTPDLNSNDKPDDEGEDQPTPLLIGITAQTPPCVSLTKVLYKQDFGSGSTSSILPSPPSGTTDYTGSTAQPLAEDRYMITPNANNANNSRFISLNDHTGNSGGRMMVVNADASNKVIYSATVDGLCANLQYSLFFYAAFVGNSDYSTICDAFGGFKYPRIRMRIRDAASSAIITEMSTTDITATSWNQYGMKWVMPSGFSSVIFELINDGQGGCGNDIAIDDIQLGLCDPVPTVSLANTSSGCLGNATTFTATLNDAGVIPGVKEYLWQISADGASWSNITGATGENYTIPSLVATDVDRYYRVIVAAQGNINSTTCSYTSPGFLLTAKSVSTAPSGVTASTNNICPGDAVTLSVQGGNLGTGAVWRWYSGGCGGTLIGTGATLEVSPVMTTTYFVRAEGDCNTTACAQVTVVINCPVLDCKYINFKAKVISYNAVKLNWSLYCDQETSAFIVERKDVAGFIPVHIENNITEFNRNLDYETTDDLAGVKAAEVYYRIRTVNKDGGMTYSNMLKVQLIPSPGKVQVIGNPVLQELKAMIELASSASGQFELLDGNGRVVKRLVQPVAAGKSYVRMNVGHLPPGTYFFHALIDGKSYSSKVYVVK